MYKNQYKGFTFSFGSSKCEDNNGKQISKSMDNFNFTTGIPCVKDDYGLEFPNEERSSSSKGYYLAKWNNISPT